MSEKTMINKFALLRFVLGNDAVICGEEPAEAPVPTKTTPVAPKAFPVSEPPVATTGLSEPFAIGGPEERKLSDAVFVPIPPKARPKTEAEMRHDLEVLEARTMGMPAPVPDAPLDATPRTAILWWLEHHGMSAATCRRHYVPQMLLDLRKKKVVFPDRHANRVLFEIEEEQRIAQTIVARRR